MLLDLRTIAPGDPEWGRLLDRRPFRSAGTTALPREFFEQRVARDFDLLIRIETTTAARPVAKSP